MTKYVGVERDQKGLEKAFKLVKDIYLKYNISIYQLKWNIIIRIGCRLI